jgi:F0F1-type ATP synthase membrane subunit b/b'
MVDDPETPIQEIEVKADEPGESSGQEFLDRAKEKLDQAFEEAKQELTELVEEAKEEFGEIREKAPGWVKDARRKVADFLEPEPDPKKE